MRILVAIGLTFLATASLLVALASGIPAARAQAALQAPAQQKTDPPTAGPDAAQWDKDASASTARNDAVARGTRAKPGAPPLNVADLLDGNATTGKTPSGPSSRRAPSGAPVAKPAPLRDPVPVTDPPQLAPPGETASSDENGPLMFAIDLPDMDDPGDTEGLSEDPSAGLDLAPPQDPADPTAVEPAPATPRELSPGLVRLRDKVRSCLTYYYQRPENVAERSPWGIMHALIAYGVDTEVLANGKRVNAFGWVCWNNPCRGMRLLTVRRSLPEPRNGPGLQGHEGQLLSMLALSRVPITYPIKVEGREFTVADLVEYEKLTCRPKSELTFKLIGLAHYLESDSSWTCDKGEQWDIARLIREELAQPIKGATCGGTHRLIGLSMAVQVREKRGEPVEGPWAQAKKYVSDYHKYAMRLQNPDGSFSTSWFERRNSTGDLNRRLQTTGHVLEWMIFSLPEDDLTDPRVVKSIDYLATLLLNNRNEKWEIGYRGHALRALALYSERVFGDKPGERREMLARRPGN